MADFRISATSDDGIWMLPQKMFNAKSNNKIMIKHNDLRIVG